MDWLYKCIPAIILFIYSMVLFSGRGTRLLAGFSTMSKNEYNTYDRKAVSKFMGKIFLIADMGLILLIVGESVDSFIIHIIGLGIFLGSLIFAIVYANTNNRFKLK
jgi:hypothetical protein